MPTNDDAFFSATELLALREHGVVLFDGRVIYDARPPMPPERVAAVQAQCAGPLPAALLKLWETTAGGRLDYDLTLPMAGNLEAVSWCELFHDGSDGYHDLAGWIEHERQLADEAAAEAGHATGALLSHLPIGGFEHSDRIYAVVEPGAQHGSIVAWKEGLPPAWTHDLHQDAICTVGPDLNAAFAALHLVEDPLAPTDDAATGQALLAYLDERHESHGLDLDLIDKLIAWYRRALLDWRTPLADGSLRQQPLLAHAALRHAINLDDAELVAELAAAGVRFDGPLEGSANAIDVALAHAAFAVAAALLRAGAPVAPDALANIDEATAPELVTQLIDSGAEPNVAAMVKCVACGAPASARVIGAACAAVDIDVPAAFATIRDAMLAELQAALAKIQDPAQVYGHYLGPHGLAQRIEHLRSFEL